MFGYGVYSNLKIGLRFLFLLFSFACNIASIILVSSTTIIIVHSIVEISDLLSQFFNNIIMWEFCSNDIQCKRWYVLPDDPPGGASAIYLSKSWRLFVCLSVHPCFVKRPDWSWPNLASILCGLFWVWFEPKHICLMYWQEEWTHYYIGPVPARYVRHSPMCPHLHVSAIKMTTKRNIYIRQS